MRANLLTWQCGIAVFGGCCQGCGVGVGGVACFQASVRVGVVFLKLLESGVKSRVFKTAGVGILKNLPTPQPWNLVAAILVDILLLLLGDYLSCSRNLEHWGNGWWLIRSGELNLGIKRLEFWCFLIQIIYGKQLINVFYALFSLPSCWLSWRSVTGRTRASCSWTARPTVSPSWEAFTSTSTSSSVRTLVSKCLGKQLAIYQHFHSN